MAKKAKKVEAKIKKKKWFSIVAPKFLSEQVLGESLADQAKELIGKTVTANLMNLTGDPKKQSVNLRFQVTAVGENKVMTECIGYDISPSSIKRIVRRNRERLDDSFVVMTSDQKLVRIKPLVLTRFNTNRSVTTTLRKRIRVEVQQAVNSNTFEGLVRDLSQNKFQTKLKDSLKKIYPVAICEVRNLLIVTKPGVKPLSIKTEEVAEEEPEEIEMEEEAKEEQNA